MMDYLEDKFLRKLKDNKGIEPEWIRENEDSSMSEDESHKVNTDNSEHFFDFSKHPSLSGRIESLMAKLKEGRTWNDQFLLKFAPGDNIDWDKTPNEFVFWITEAMASSDYALKFHEIDSDAFFVKLAKYYDE